MKRKSFLIHALSPVHCGTGQGVDIIDLPIARMRATGIPYIPGSSLKGVLRSMAPTDQPEKTKAVYGPDTKAASDHAGAFTVGDARLLLLPVRSFIGTFAWVTSPLLLHLAARDLKLDFNELPTIPSLSKRSAARTTRNENVHENRTVFLEDIDLPVDNSLTESANQWLETFRQMLPKSEAPLLEQHLIIIDDESMTFFFETATQVDARNRINERGVVVDGALWYEESLPPETILIGQIAAEQSRHSDEPMTADEVLDFALPNQTSVLQVGGKATVGRGVCNLYTTMNSPSPA